jgi:hypothetical protein
VPAPPGKVPVQACATGSSILRLTQSERGDIARHRLLLGCKTRSGRWHRRLLALGVLEETEVL